MARLAEARPDPKVGDLWQARLLALRATALGFLGGMPKRPNRQPRRWLKASSSPTRSPWPMRCNAVPCSSEETMTWPPRSPAPTGH